MENRPLLSVPSLKGRPEILLAQVSPRAKGQIRPNVPRCEAIIDLELANLAPAVLCTGCAHSNLSQLANRGLKVEVENGLGQYKARLRMGHGLAGTAARPCGESSQGTMRYLAGLFIPRNV